jgi:hypothetical protein
MAIKGQTTSKGFTLPEAYVNIGVISHIKVPFAEQELQVLFRLYKDKETYRNAPLSAKNEYALEMFTVYIDARDILPENHTQAAYNKLKTSPRFAAFVDDN